MVASHHERLASSCDWVTRHLDEFFPAARGPHAFAHVKSLAELALVLRQLEAAGPAADAARWAPAWRAFVIDRLECPAFAEAPRRRPALAYAYLVPYLMVRNGYASDFYEGTLRELDRAGALLPAELLPYRALDRHYAFWAGGTPLPGLDWDRLYRATDLGRGGDLYYHDEHLAYAATHTVLYLTDFGGRAHGLPGSEVARVVAILERFLVHYWRVANWDLVGELLACVGALGAGHTWFSAAAREALHAVWGSDGSVPPRTCREAAQASGGTADAFRERYHTTLVGVLYSLTALRAEHEASAHV